MSKNHSFSWGAIIRPLTITLGDGCYLWWQMSDCTGLMMGDPDIPESGYFANLRTSEEMRAVADWLDTLSRQAAPASGPISLDLPGFSMFFADESFVDDETGEVKYDATLLHVDAFVTQAGHLLFQHDDDDGIMSKMGVPWNLLPALASALRELADTWDDGTLMLGEDDPLLDDPNEPASSGKTLTLTERRAA